MAAVASYFRLAFAPRRAAMTFASIWIEFPRRRANAKRGSALLLILRIHVRQDVLLHLHDRLIDLAIGAHVRARDHLVQLVRLDALRLIGLLGGGEGGAEQDAEMEVGDAELVVGQEGGPAHAGAV